MTPAAPWSRHPSGWATVPNLDGIVESSTSVPWSSIRRGQGILDQLIPALRSHQQPIPPVSHFGSAKAIASALPGVDGPALAG